MGFSHDWGYILSGLWMLLVYKFQPERLRKDAFEGLNPLNIFPEYSN